MKCICVAGHKISCPIHGLKEERKMNLFSEGQTVVDIFDESETEWLVWEQKGDWVMIFNLTGVITLKPAKHLHIVKMP